MPLQAHIIEAPGGGGDNGDEETALVEGGDGDSNGDNGNGGDDDEPMEEIVMKENYYYLEHILALLSLAHCLASIALLIAYYQLKVRFGFAGLQVGHARLFWYPSRVGLGKIQLGHSLHVSNPHVPCFAYTMGRYIRMKKWFSYDF